MNTSQVMALTRHATTAAASVAATLAAVHLLTPDQAQQVGASVNQIATGVGAISDGVAKLLVVGAPLVALVSAWFSKRSASSANQILATGNNPDVARVVMRDPAAAAAIPSDKVVGPSGA